MNWAEEGVVNEDVVKEDGDRTSQGTIGLYSSTK